MSQLEQKIETTTCTDDDDDTTENKSIREQKVSPQTIHLRIRTFLGGIKKGARKATSD